MTIVCVCCVCVALGFLLIMAELTANLSNILPLTYAKIAAQAIEADNNVLNNLLTHHAVPRNGVGDAAIMYILSTLSAMDHNQHPGIVHIIITSQ